MNPLSPPKAGPSGVPCVKCRPPLPPLILEGGASCTAATHNIPPHLHGIRTLGSHPICPPAPGQDSHFSEPQCPLLYQGNGIPSSVPQGCQLMSDSAGAFLLLWDECSSYEVKMEEILRNLPDPQPRPSQALAPGPEISAISELTVFPA